VRAGEELFVVAAHFGLCVGWVRSGIEGGLGEFTSLLVEREVENVESVGGGGVSVVDVVRQIESNGRQCLISFVCLFTRVTSK
jgi:hypothetical protein